VLNTGMLNQNKNPIRQEATMGQAILANRIFVM
jgi:hypothetical protein